MNLSALFIARPVATTLLTIGLALAGAGAFLKLPVSPLPKVDYPTIQVSASLPGASPETGASSLTTPLERALGAIAGVTEMTSTSTVGNSRITLQFDLSRSIDGAARDASPARLRGDHVAELRLAALEVEVDERGKPEERAVATPDGEPGPASVLPPALVAADPVPDERLVRACRDAREADDVRVAGQPEHVGHVGLRQRLEVNGVVCEPRRRR